MKKPAPASHDQCAILENILEYLNVALTYKLDFSVIATIISSIVSHYTDVDT